MATQPVLDIRSAQVRDALLRIAREIGTPGFCSEMLAQAIWVETTIELHRYLRRSGAQHSAAGNLSRKQMQRIKRTGATAGQAAAGCRTR